MSLDDTILFAQSPELCELPGGVPTNPFDKSNAGILRRRRLSDYEVEEQIERINDRIAEYQLAIERAKAEIDLLGKQRYRLEQQANMPGEYPG